MAKKEAKSGKCSGDTVGGVVNLTPFPKGVSGNPNGKPKGAKNKTTILREAMRVMNIQDRNGETLDDPMLYFAVRVLDIIEDGVAKGSGNPAVALNALKELADRFVAPIERTVRHGRTPDEMALAGRDVFRDIESLRNGAEEAEIIEEQDES